ncbi:MAG TPA: hypothetical protein VMR70_13890 [Flavisolibacter sp.]|nr:hypothetical protein [Flavisolibacter sp.]
MSGFPILDLVLGIIFIYFLLSIISSSVVEIVMTVKRTRAKVLTEWLLRIFDTQITTIGGQTAKMGKEIMDHCALTALSKTGKAPSYIDAKNFTTALLDKIIQHSSSQNPTDLQGIIKALESTTALSAELRKTFLLFAYEAQDTFNAVSARTIGAMETFRGKMENWYDTNMDRISGTMKLEHTRWYTTITAIAVTLVLNADTITIAKYLYSNEDARTAIAAKAYETGADQTIKAKMDSLRQVTGSDTAAIRSLNELQAAVDAKLQTINKAKAALDETIPVGWNKGEFTAAREGWEWPLFLLLKLAGLTLTALAIMMGAPFWFDVLNKVSNIRGTGPKPSSSTDSNFNKPKR